MDIIHEASNLATKHVTVYGDRAEVNKVIKVHLNQGGNEVVITKLSRSLDNDSIRVEGYGKATITEVKYQEKKVIKDQKVKDEEKEKALQQEIKKMKQERYRIELKMSRFKNQADVLDRIAHNLGGSGNISGEHFGVKPKIVKDDHHSSANNFIIDNDALQNLQKFLAYYEKRTNEVDDSLNDLTNKLDKINEEINVANSKLSVEYPVCYSHVKEVTIFVTAREQGEVLLDLFYVVCKASWKPSYDIRVQTNEAAMKVTYYGLIQQDTDEDWKDTKLTLSTATPRIGGQVPELGTTKVSLYKPPLFGISLPRTSNQTGLFGCGSVVSAPTNSQAGIFTFGGAGSRNIASEISHDDTPRMSYVEAVVKENVTSAAFGIENSTSVPSDNSKHKVTIGIIDLKPTFEYECVPSKSTYAYFKAKVTNTSQYPFLAGPTAIFVNQSFVANGSMISVNPSEQFDVSLGVDPAIKIEYKAAKKFNEESGILSKSSILTQEQKIGLNNTKSEVVRLTVIEALPQSTEERLKITLLEPSLYKNDKHTVLNKHNNIEWKMSLEANEKKDLVLKYQIEHPKGEQVEFKQE